MMGHWRSPGSFYAATTPAAERALLDLHHTEGLRLCILRLAFVYGEGDPHVAEAARRARTWPVAKKLHMVHHADVAQAVMRALDAPAASGTLYNVADDEPVSAADVLQLNGLAVTEEARQLVPDDPWEGIVDTARIRNELGFRPIYRSIHAAKDADAL
jgi:nucleoside-diphosphate-sugar epimerase